MPPSSLFLDYLATLGQCGPLRDISHDQVCARINVLWSSLAQQWKQDYTPGIVDAILLALSRHALHAIAVTQSDPVDAYACAVATACDIHHRKNAGYAGADQDDPWRNFRQCEAFGIHIEDGIITRMSDKMARWQNLRRDPVNEQVGESILDTLLDLANYAVILVCVRQEAR